MLASKNYFNGLYRLLGLQIKSPSFQKLQNTALFTHFHHRLGQILFNFGLILNTRKGFLILFTFFNVLVAHFLYHRLCLGAHLVGFLSWRWLHVTLCYKVCPVLLGEVCSLCPCKIKSTIDWRGCSTERDSVGFLIFYGGSLLTFLIKFVDNLNHCDNFFLFHIWLVFRDHFRRVNCDEFCRTALCFIANAAFFVESLACSLAFARCWHSLSHVVCLNDDFLTSFNARKM